MLLKGGGGAPKTGEIGRLTSDIGLRPNASCPAGSMEMTVAETGGPRQGRELPAPLHYMPLRSADSARGSWCKGVFLPTEKRFLENLAPQWVDGYLNHQLLWLHGIKFKGKVC